MQPEMFAATPKSGNLGTPPGIPLHISIIQQYEELSYFLKDIDFVSSDVGWAAGEPHLDQASRQYVSTIIKTTDGGATWTPQIAGPVTWLNKVDFIDENNGWTVGEDGIILHTADGGIHWVRQTVDTQDVFLGVSFISSFEGWVTGSCVTKYHEIFQDEIDWKASIWHTADGGATWQLQDLPETASQIRAIQFLDAQHGYAVGIKNTGREETKEPIHAGVVYRTSDGGKTWGELSSLGDNIFLHAAEWIDENNGWVGGFPKYSDMEGGFIFHTADGGKTWERQTPGGFGHPIKDIQFVDANRGYAVGTAYGAAYGPPVYRTLDGGKTWIQISMDKHQGEGIYALSIVDNRVLLVGDYDFIARSDQAWESPDKPLCHNASCIFTQSYINPHYIFHDVFFADERNGWVVGSESISPMSWEQVILHSADGGETWSTQYEIPPLSGYSSDDKLESVTFVDPTNGWAVGTSGWWPNQINYILHTSDGGKTWISQGSELNPIMNPDFSSIQFIDSRKGWALASINSMESDNDHYVLAKTNDGGQHWVWVDTNITEEHFGWAASALEVRSMLSFPDAQHGWAAGGDGQIISTSDGGVHWMRQNLSCSDNKQTCTPRITAAFFLTNRDGWIAGQNMYHTMDGGQTWAQSDLWPVGTEYTETEDYGDVQDIQFLTPEKGLTATDSGLVFYTDDGGAHWNPVGEYSYYPLRGLQCPSARKCWVVGEGGTILAVELPA
jgi:photosystem II stability/assembly factor-like uncharacterized protein